MEKDWMKRIEEAQTQRTYIISGRSYKRISFGEEGFEDCAYNEPCGDCAVVKGQLHVPLCDMETCPKCKGQNIACACNKDKRY